MAAHLRECLECFRLAGVRAQVPTDIINRKLKAGYETEPRQPTTIAQSVGSPSEIIHTHYYTPFIQIAKIDKPVIDNIFPDIYKPIFESQATQQSI